MNKMNLKENYIHLTEKEVKAVVYEEEEVNKD